MAALLLAGPVRAQALLHVLASPNEEADGGFGRAVAGVPDVDGDGHDDLLIGAFGEGTGGRAYVFSGATGGLLHTLLSPQEEGGGRFGFAVSGAGDLDGDGRGDLAVGADREAYGAAGDAGRVHVFSGATGALLYSLASPNPEDVGAFGQAVAGMPDVDGDGRDDLVIGAPLEGGGVSTVGCAYVFSGATGDLIHTLVSPHAPEERGSFGSAVVGVPDVDGDGRSDVLVGAPAVDLGPFAESAGRAYLFSGATGALLRQLDSDAPTDLGEFGFSVSGLEDVDGDGYGDLAVGAPGEGASGTRGVTYLFSGATGARLHRLYVPSGGWNMFGFGVAGIEDASGDGRWDLVVGAPGNDSDGRAYVVDGATGALFPPLAASGTREFGAAVAGAGDVNNDGRGDIVVGDPQASSNPSRAGRAYVYAAPTPPFALSAAALNSPVPHGDTLHFDVVLYNNTDQPRTVALRLDLAGPDGYSSSRLLEAGITLDASAFIERTYSELIADNAPLGRYTATATMRDGGTLLASRAFAFEVVTGTAIEAEPDEAARAVVVPNPTSDRAALRLTLAQPSAVRVVLYDVLGRAVARVEAAQLAEGEHRLLLDFSDLPTGVYAWRLTAGARVESGMLTVAR